MAKQRNEIIRKYRSNECREAKRSNGKIEWKARSKPCSPTGMHSRHGRNDCCSSRGVQSKNQRIHTRPSLAYRLLGTDMSDSGRTKCEQTFSGPSIDQMFNFILFISLPFPFDAQVLICAFDCNCNMQCSCMCHCRRGPALLKIDSNFLFFSMFDRWRY